MSGLESIKAKQLKQTALYCFSITGTIKKCGPVYTIEVMNNFYNMDR